MNMMPPLLAASNISELFLNYVCISGRYPLPEKNEQLVLLRVAGGGLIREELFPFFTV